MKKMKWIPSLTPVLAWILAIAPTLHAAAAAPDLPQIPPHTFSLQDYGGVPDGVTLNTEAFSKAIAAASQAGGGRLTVPSGLWLTGPITLCSHLDLHLDRGAVILFSGDYHLYPLRVFDVRGEKEVGSAPPVSGVGLEDVAITGEGILDGGGSAWRPVKRGKMGEADWNALVHSGGVLDARKETWWPSRSAMNGENVFNQLESAGDVNPTDYEAIHDWLRPRMVRLLDCRRVLLQGVTFQNPPNWTLNPQLCENVSILNVTVHNPPYAQNSDALDLESCRHALIRNCTFEAGDDGICLKSGKDAEGRRIGVPTEDVDVEGCTVYYAHGGFVVGSEMSGGVRNIRVHNCTFMGTEVGLRFKSTRGRGGVVENVDISDIHMANILGGAIDFNLFYGGKPPGDTAGQEAEDAAPVDEGTPQFRNIRISHLTCRGAMRAILLEGLPEMPLKNIVLNDVMITSREGVWVQDASNVDFENVRVDNQTGPALTEKAVQHSRIQVLK